MQPWVQGWVVKLPGLPEGSWDDGGPPSADCLHDVMGLEAGWQIRLEARRRAKLDFVPRPAGKAGVGFCPPTYVCVFAHMHACVKYVHTSMSRS